MYTATHARLRHPRRWVMEMRWESLAFLHWRVPPERLGACIPEGLALDTFDGEAWLGVVPFRMSGVRARLLPPVPGTSAFLELNVRTYVTRGGMPGVFFFSLDAASRLAVRGARRAFHLPYFDAAMALERDGDGVHYRSVRTHRGAPAAAFEATYAPAGPVLRAGPGTLERFLTDRLSFYAAADDGRLFRADVHHEEWPLQPARAEIRRNTMTAPLGLPLEGPPVAHFSAGLDVVAWWRERV